MLDFYKEGGGFYEEEDGLVTYCSVISRGLRTSFLWEVYGVEVTTRGLCRDPTILSLGVALREQPLQALAFWRLRGNLFIRLFKRAGNNKNPTITTSRNHFLQRPGVDRCMLLETAGRCQVMETLLLSGPL